MKIGIYLGYGPNTLMHKEGLGRYTAVLLKGFIERGHSITVAMPKWLAASFKLLLDEFEIDSQNIDYIIEYHTPVAWEIYSHMHMKKKGGSGLKRKIMISSLKLSERIMNYIFSISNILLLLAVTVIILAIALVLLPIGLIVCIVVGFVYGIFSIFIREKRKHQSVKNRMKKKIKNLLIDLTGTGVSLHSIVYQNMLVSVQHRLVNRINTGNKKVDVWYSPSIFWPVFNHINGKRIINVPDLVVMDYPMHWYESYGVIESSLRCEDTIINGESYITYCQYVKDNLLVKRYEKNEDSISVIHHMINDMSSYIKVNSEYKMTSKEKENYEKAFCRSLIGKMRNSICRVKEYTSTFDFANTKYIFYSSQARPHKNLMSLLKAYKYILKEKRIGIKLFLTGDIYQIKELKEFVLENGLQYDVLCFYSVPAQGLAALYHEAELVVNPTLYEGGFPFTFGEGMSVGTPSLMSRIPQVEEMFAFSEDLENCMFDPYDYRDMVAKILWGLSDPNRLYEMQLPLFRKMCERGTAEYIGEYVRAFEKAL